MQDDKDMAISLVPWIKRSEHSHIKIGPGNNVSTQTVSNHVIYSELPVSEWPDTKYIKTIIDVHDTGKTSPIMLRLNDIRSPKESIKTWAPSLLLHVTMDMIIYLYFYISHSLLVEVAMYNRSKSTGSIK